MGNDFYIVPFASRQRGVALLLMFILLFMAGIGAFIKVLNNNRTELRREAETFNALQETREALIAFAVSYGDYYGDAGAGPGHLLCPDTNNNATENLPCANNALGRLPHNIVLPSGETLYLSQYGANADQQFWYALSNDFRRNPATAINTTVQGGLTVDGVTGFVAVLLAPGLPLDGQTRVSNVAGNYLESGNETAPGFVTFDPVNADAFNDLLVTITDQEIRSPVTARVAERIRTALDDYHLATGRYPPNQTVFRNLVNGVFNGGTSPLPAWFASNNWLAVSTYNRIDFDNATVVFNGCGITYSFSFAAPAITRSQSIC